MVQKGFENCLSCKSCRKPDLHHRRLLNSETARGFADARDWMIGQLITQESNLGRSCSHDEREYTYFSLM